MELSALLERTLPGLGFELVDLESSPRGRVIRVFIDKPSGVDVEDCARLSNHLIRLFAVEGIDYERLEVSSPGLDRPLKREEDFARFAGSPAWIRLRSPRDNVRKFQGTLKGVDAHAVLIDTPRGMISLPFEEIERARLIPQIEWRRP